MDNQPAEGKKKFKPGGCSLADVKKKGKGWGAACLGFKRRRLGEKKSNQLGGEGR